MDNSELVLYEDHKPGIEACINYHPRPWKVEIRKTNRCRRSYGGHQFVIVDALGMEVKIQGQAIRHLLVDAVNAFVLQ